MQKKLNGLVALVTGGSRGIGRAIALDLSQEGATVAVNYRSGESQAQEVVDIIHASGGKAIAIQSDVTDYEQVNAMIQDTINKLGGLDILVNNAGVAKDGLIFNLEPGDWLDVMQVNFGGVFNCTKAAIAHFMSQRNGAIVNISSVMGERGWIGESNYAASKGAINAFTRCCAMELARFNIRVNAVLPGFCSTDLVTDLLAKEGNKILKQIPSRTFAKPEEVAKVVTFLATSDSSYVTGSLVTVDGGLSTPLAMGKPSV